MTGYALRFYRDVIRPDAGPVALPAAVRTLYVRSGAVQLAGASVSADETRFCDSEIAISTGPDGATLWCCEFAPAAVSACLLQNIDSTLLLDSPLTTLPPEGDLMMRCDSVAFQPGGCAYTHTHRGPGIRCLQKGSIRIDSDCHSARYRTGEPWFGSGPVPVFAQADADRETRFIRVSILPRSLEGKSSIAYVLPEDQDKPKTQTYRGYFDRFIES